MLITCIKTFIKKLPTWSGQVILRISKPEVSGIIFVSLWFFFSRKIISWNISSKPNADLVIQTFQKAYRSRNFPAGLMFHSDKGSQYTACAFRKLLDELNVVQSFSKKGYPFDNACCESFFKYLKKEETNRRNFRTYRDLYHSVFQYIEGFYNSRRPHGSLGYLTPNEMEATFWDRQGI